MANSSSPIGEIASRVAAFLCRWVQSPSTDYDSIVATTFEAEWTRLHRPIITTVRLELNENLPGVSDTVTRHTLYTPLSPSVEENGVVRCRNGCHEPIIARERGNLMRLRCPSCRSHCLIRPRRQSRANVLTVHNLAAVTFPEVEQQVDWEEGDVDPDTPYVSSDTDDEDLISVGPEKPVSHRDKATQKKSRGFLSVVAPSRRSPNMPPSPSPSPSTMSGSSLSSAQVETEPIADDPVPSSSGKQRKRPRDSPPSKLPEYLVQFNANPIKHLPLKRVRSAPVPHYDATEQQEDRSVEAGIKKKQPRKTRGRK